MNKKITTVVAALTALGTVATAMPAVARDHGHRSEWRERGDHRDRDDRREWRRDRGDRYDRYDRDDRRSWRDRRGVSYRYYGGNYGYNGYDGYYRVGQRYPYYQNRGYYLTNYYDYGLPAPRPGYRYYRERNGDIVMAAIAGGLIGLIIGAAAN